jgi:signal transduction histidine kinase
MGAGNTGFMSCSLLAHEVQRVTERLELNGAPRVSFHSDCHAPSGCAVWPPGRVQELLEECHTVVALCMNCRRPGNGVHPRAGSVASIDSPKLRLVSVQTQGELFLGADATSQALAEGAFLVLPGWLSRWRHIVRDCWGFDAETARAFFAESATRLLVLDTDCGGGWEREIEALADFVGLPVERRYVGTSHLELLVEKTLVQDERVGAVRTTAEARAQAADYAVIVDFITGLGGLPSPQAILQALEDAAMMLFAPQAVRTQLLERAPPPLEGPDSFAVDLRYGSTYLGVLQVEGIALLEQRDRYLPLAQVIAQAAGIALHASQLLVRERELTQQLERKVQELDQFAYVASHDLQAPLRRTISFAGMLTKSCGDDLSDRGRLYLEHIERNATLMRSLVQDLLRLSRAGNNPLRLQPVDLDACLDRALVALDGAIEDSRARIDRGPLPQVHGDAGLLAQVFQNLVGNALKFVPDGVRPQVSIRAERDDDRWLVSVTDNGIGICAEDAATIFQPFKRLHKAQDFEGTGIGLAICGKVVERHGGSITGGPGPDGGAVFRFSLPAGVPSTSQEQPR